MTNIRLSSENMDRVEAIQTYFRDLEPISVDLSPTDVVTMALRDLYAVLESTESSEEDSPQSASEEDPLPPELRVTPLIPALAKSNTTPLVSALAKLNTTPLVSALAKLNATPLIPALAKLNATPLVPALDARTDG